MKSKSLITILIIAIVGALAAAWYFMWYIPHTPAYTLKIIHQAVQDKDADEALRHIDTSNPFGKATIAAAKTFGPSLIEDVMRKYIEDPDSFKSQPATTDTNNTAQSDDNMSMVDRLVDGRLFKEHDVEVKNIKSEDDGDTAIVTVTIQNNKKNMTKDIRVLMRHLGDGTWVIYDIPDMEDLYTVTRK